MSRELEETTLFFSDRALGWQAINKLLGSQALKSLYPWLFIVPIVAKLTLHLPHEVVLSVQALSEPIRFGFDIPFSWKLLYFSALLVGIARAVYTFRCPSFIRDYNTATEAISAGLTSQYVKSASADFLRDYFDRLLPVYSSMQGQNLRKLLRQYRANVDDVELQWCNEVRTQDHVGWLLFDGLESVRFRTDENGNYIFTKDGTYNMDSRYESRVTISAEQFLKHQCWDLIELQNLSFERWRTAITLLLGASVILAIWPLLQSVYFVLTVFFLAL